MAPTLEARKARLFERLEAVHEELGALSKLQTATGFGCRQTGSCCQVGLELHWMECEHIARKLEAEFAADPRARARRVTALKRSLGDKEWTAESGWGDMMCAFFRNGCSIYSVRPSVCRMYGPLLAVDDECPRERIAGRPFVYFGEDVDHLVRRVYRVLDDYGRLTGRDRAIYLPTGVLSFLLPKGELRELRRRTHSKFWRTTAGYRTQFVPEHTQVRALRKAEAAWTNPATPFPFLPSRPRAVV